MKSTNDNSLVRFGLLLCLLLAGMASGQTARADDPVWVTGRVIDDDGRAIRNALVAAYDDHNKVVDYARTDERGEYALAVPRHAVHLEHKRGKGFVAEVFGTVQRFVGGATAFVANPIRAGVHAVTSSQAANFTDPITKGGFAAGGVVIDQVLDVVSPRPRRAVLPEARKQPGVLLVKVVAPNSNDLVGLSQVYWVEEETFHAGGKSKKTLAAWLDPVELTGSSNERASRIQNEYLRFTAARLEPSIAQPGERVRISARLLLPPTPRIYAVVVARNNRTGEKWEMVPTGGGRYEGEFLVDKRFPKNDQTISILAYADNESREGRRDKTERAIEGAGLWNAEKPYLYDPLLVVSRNRADLTLTVLAPHKSGR